MIHSNEHYHNNVIFEKIGTIRPQVNATNQSIIYRYINKIVLFNGFILKYYK